ncbi:MAG: hypothetical protein K6T85_16015, partial [Gorillibacterium sp.]|nr:hypothetical protein [Gorillibacterium sp.]
VLLREIHTTTIRTKLENYIKRNEITAQYFARIAGINPGTISAILNLNRPISMTQLDRLTVGMELPEGALYDLYINECFVDHTPHWRRLRPFLLRCAELNKFDCIKLTVQKMMENLSYISLIFDMAEVFYHKEKHEAAELLYESVVESEKYQHSERLAICHYRLFRLTIDRNPQANLRAVIHFELFQDKLPDDYRLDGLLQLANAYYLLRCWEKMAFFADELRTLVQVLYRDRKMTKRKIDVLNTEHPLVFYYGQGFLLKGAALEHQEQYGEVEPYIDGYADLSWFEELDELGQLAVEKFKLFAQVNRYNLQLLAGNFSLLSTYASFLETSPQEILPSMVIILKAANKHRVSVDHVLKQFVDILDGQVKAIYDHEASYISRYNEFYYQLALYQFSHERNRNGIESTLQSLRISVQQGNTSNTLFCISLFKQFKEFATAAQYMEYEALIKRVGKDEESYALRL